MPIAEGTAAALISAAGALGSAGLGVSAGLFGQKKQYKLNRRGMYEASALNQQLRQNWDTPEAQRRQIERAGISLGLMYGGSGVSNGATQKIDAPTTGGIPPMNSFLNLDMAQISKAIAEAREANSRAALNEANTDRTKALMPFEIATMNANIDLIKNSSLSEEKKAELIEAEKRDWEARAEINEKSKDDQIEAFRLNVDLLKEKLKQEQFTTVHQPEEFYAKMRLMESQTKMYIAEAFKFSKEAEEIQQRINELNPAQIAYWGALKEGSQQHTELERYLTGAQIKQVKILDEKLEQERVKSKYAAAYQVQGLITGYADCAFRGISAVKGTSFAPLTTNNTSTTTGESTNHNFNLNESIP